MTNSVTKIILALCLGASALIGCGGDPAEDAANEADSAGSNAADGQELNATGIRYISYGALNKNTPNRCGPFQVWDDVLQKCVTTPANIWKRGCSAATRCKRE